VDQASLIKLAVALGVVYAVYKFVPNAAAKAAALGVGGVIVAKRIPFVKEAMA
jgi:gamma-glutamyl phosphate reductase